MLEGYNLVINCSGAYGARDLMNDETITPVSGHVLRVKAPWINASVGYADKDGDTYIIPK